MQEFPNLVPSGLMLSLGMRLTNYLTARNHSSLKLNFSKFLEDILFQAEEKLCFSFSSHDDSFSDNECDNNHEVSLQLHMKIILEVHLQS